MSRTQEIVAILGLIVAVIACIGGWLAVPQIQRLIEQMPSPSTQTTAIVAQRTSTSTQVPPTMTTPQPTATPVPTQAPAPTKLSISGLNRLAILTLFEIPRKTKTDVDRLDTIFRPNRSSSLVVIPNYPLLSKYVLDEYGYISENRQAIDIPLGTDLGKYLDIDWGQWKKYLGVFDFVIPATKTVQFCGFYVRSESGGLNWESSQRFIYSADIGTNDFKIERASWVEIKDCSDSPTTDWSRKQAEGAWAPTDSVYYWDKVSNKWVQLK